MDKTSRLKRRSSESFSLLDYSDCKEIDKFNLDEELVKHPQLFYLYSEAYSKAQMETQKAKDSWELRKAELELEIKDDPGKFGLKKDTESIVKAKLMTMQEIKKLYEIYLAKLGVERILSKAERAFEHRKKSLEGLVSLQVQNYYSQPKSSDTQQRADSKDLLKKAREKKR